jgi:hypothetical protein
MEIDQVLPSPAQRRVPGRPGQRRAGRHMVIVAWRDIASPQAAGSIAVRHFTAVIDEAADGAR